MRRSRCSALLLLASCGSPPVKGNESPTACRPTDEVANDGVDQDCDGRDLVDLDGDGWSAGADCNDTDAGIHPDAVEVCDGIDQDCDGEVDEDALDSLHGFVDADGDGYGDPEVPWAHCQLLGPSRAGDCDDEDDSVFPGAPEVCDGVDQDCDGDVDEDAIDAFSGFIDADGDGYGSNSRPWNGCDSLGPETGGDCDDSNAAVNPEAPETCRDRVDNNCDGFVDEMVAGLTHGSVQQAIDAACEDGDTVWVAPGIYAENVVIDRSIALRSISGPDSTRIEGVALSGESPVIRVDAHAVVVEGLEVMFGVGKELGGGLSAQWVLDLTVTGCRFQNNYSGQDGGGLYCACSGRIEGNEFRSNSASYGGGVFVYAGSDREVALSGNTFDSNTAEFGGGAYQNFDGSVGWYNNRIVGNSATRLGGGIGAVDGLTTDGNTITGNQAAGGCGGVWANTEWDASNDTVHSNSPDDWGCLW